MDIKSYEIENVIETLQKMGLNGLMGYTDVFLINHLLELSNGDLTGSKWKNRTLIKSVSIISFLLKKKLIEMKDISDKIDVRNLDL